MSESGTSASSSEASNRSFTKVKEIKVPVHNFVLLKCVRQVDSTIFLVGTFVQTVFDENGDLDLHSHEETKFLQHFEYRINDLPVKMDSEFCKKRRTERTANTLRTTFEVNAPMDVETIFDWFPFKVSKAKMLIEMSSITTKDNKMRIRPNLLLCRSERLMNLAIQTPEAKFDIDGSEIPLTVNRETVLDKMDQCGCYDFVSPLPKLWYLYDKKKRYCPKFEVSFYLVEAGESKFVQIIFPMLLIATLNTIRIASGEDISPSGFLGNASTLGLTAVFILPSIVTKVRRPQYFTINNIYIALIFIGLTLSSVSETLVGTNIYALLGMSIVWISFVFPIYHAFKYNQFWRKMNPHSFQLNHRVKSADYKVLKIGNSPYQDNCRTVEDIIQLSVSKNNLQTNDCEANNNKKDIEYSVKKTSGTFTIVEA